MYYIKNDNEIILADESLDRLKKTLTLIPQYEDNEIFQTNENEIIVGNKLMTIKEFEEEVEALERKRLDGLSLTAADVERAIYKVKGMDFEDLIEYITTYSSNPDSTVASVDLKALKIELKANNFYRGNPYISLIGTFLGFSEKQLDEFFKTGDFSFLLPEDEELIGEDEIPF